MSQDIQGWFCNRVRGRNGIGSCIFVNKELENIKGLSKRFGESDKMILNMQQNLWKN
jgi:hypothetical protein